MRVNERKADRTLRIAGTRGEEGTGVQMLGLNCTEQCGVW